MQFNNLHERNVNQELLVRIALQMQILDFSVALKTNAKEELDESENSRNKTLEEIGTFIREHLLHSVNERMAGALIEAFDSGPIHEVH